MGIADQVKQGPLPKIGRCSVKEAISSLPKEDAKAVTDAIEAIQQGKPGYSRSWLHRILMSEGIKLGATTLARHITGECTCWKGN